MSSLEYKKAMINMVSSVHCMPSPSTCIFSKFILSKFVVI